MHYKNTTVVYGTDKTYMQKIHLKLHQRRFPKDKREGRRRLRHHNGRSVIYDAGRAERRTTGAAHESRGIWRKRYSPKRLIYYAINPSTSHRKESGKNDSIGIANGIEHALSSNPRRSSHFSPLESTRPSSLSIYVCF